MNERGAVAHARALAFSASDWRANQLVHSGEQLLGSRPPWLAPLVRRTIVCFRRPPDDDLRALRRFIEHSRFFWEAYRRGAQAPRITKLVIAEPKMGSRRFPVPELRTSQGVAEWLGIELNELDWFADQRRLNAVSTSSPLHHYVCRWFEKRGGHGGHRLLEAPKARLKAIQRRILHEVLSAVPAHEAAHGFVRGRSVHSLLQEHCGQVVILRMDLEEFFASVGAARVRRIYRSLGYPDGVARLLSGLCTTVTPHVVLEALPKPGFVEFRDEAARALRARTKDRLRLRHLPQGSPTSPALANLAAFHLDLRLAHAARAVGAHYGRYADDLVFSGGRDFARRLARFEPLAAAIALEEGFRINHRKTRALHQASRQRLLGLVANQAPAVSRAERELLEVILTNAVRRGLESQNRDQRPHFFEHLQGRVAWVTRAKPEHGLRLQRLLEQCAPPALALHLPSRSR